MPVKESGFLKSAKGPARHQPVSLAHPTNQPPEQNPSVCAAPATRVCVVAGACMSSWPCRYVSGAPPKHLPGFRADEVGGRVIVVGDRRGENEDGHCRWGPGAGGWLGAGRPSLLTQGRETDVSKDRTRFLRAPMRCARQRTYVCLRLSSWALLEKPGECTAAELR